MGFPILKLPLLAVYVVIENLQLDEIIDLSLCSSRCKRVIKSLKKQRYKSMDIDVIYGYPAFKFMYEKKNGPSWHFNNLEVEKVLKKSKRGEKRKKYEKRKIGGINIKVMKCEENSLFSKQIDAFQLKIILDFLLDLFNNIPISRYSSMIKENQLNITPEYFGLKKCSSVFYSSLRVPIPGDELQYLFENIQVSEDITINGSVSDEFRLNKTKFSTNELNICPAPWITRGTFLSLNCSRMCLEYVSLTVNDFQSFVLQWLNSENNSFVWLQISFTGNHVPIDFSQFQAQQWDPNVRERYYDNCLEDGRFTFEFEMELVDANLSEGLMSHREAAHRLRDLGAAFNTYMATDNFHTDCNQDCVFELPPVRPLDPAYLAIGERIVQYCGNKLLTVYLVNIESKNVIFMRGALIPTMEQTGALLNMHSDGRSKFRRNKWIEINNIRFNDVTVRKMILRGTNGLHGLLSLVSSRTLVVVHTNEVLNGVEQRAIKEEVEELSGIEDDMDD